MDSVKELTKKIIKFRDARDWKKFHNPKDVAISLSLEAAEVLEHFQWKSLKEIQRYVVNHKNHIGEELADVFYWILLMFHDLKIDPVKALENKLKKNIKRYPIKKSKGSHKKYSELK
ncbi:nucleotide pyrophosphohydrolase [Patescibacteria group bacterium]|nr:nucleotide pyrophosphohydrolase [Patescibacteria group bacterium]MBU1500005.1 nucleotide pyrophosphohydrolase [Patescibacteria group bacterium]